MALHQISGVARPGAALLKALGRPPTEVQAALDDLMGVDALTDLLKEGIHKTQTSDGRVDYRDLAAFIMRRMKEHQK